MMKSTVALWELTRVFAGYKGCGNLLTMCSSARNVTACKKMFLCFVKLADGFWAGFYRRGEPAPDKES